MGTKSEQLQIRVTPAQKIAIHDEEIADFIVPIQKDSAEESSVEKSAAEKSVVEKGSVDKIPVETGQEEGK